MNRPRVGHINFLNVLPLTYAFEHGKADGLEIVSDVPAALNRKIESGELDVSAVSAITYARDAKNLFVLPDICIRSDRDVTSIVLISRKPVEKLDGEKIILTSKSATSHCLLKIILSEGYGLSPVYEIRPVTAENPVAEDAAAALLIGDDALFNYIHTPEKFYCYDLGSEWHKLTGRFMVYAVWVARKNFAEREPELLRTVYEKIVEGFNFGLQNKRDAINSVLNKKPFTFDELDKYLGETIKWNLTESGIEDLKLFYRLARKMNLAENPPEIEIAPGLRRKNF